MMEQASEQGIAGELTVARRTLEQAEIMLREGHPDAAISRGYYAVFHAARAVLHQYGSEPITHRGMISEFGRLLVKPGHVEEEFSEILRQSRDERQVADYEAYEADILPNLDFARDMVERARRFVERMAQLIESDKEFEE